MNGRLNWLAAAMNLNWNSLSPYRIFKTGGSLLLTSRGAEMQTRHSAFTGRDGEYPWYFVSVTGEVSAQLHVTAESHFYVPYSGA